MGHDWLHEPIPGYVQLNQKPQTCFPTIFQTVKERRGELLSQEYIAEQVNAYIDKRDAEFFGKPMRKRALDPKDERVGVVLSNLEDKRFAKKLEDKLGLIPEVYRPSRVSGNEIYGALMEEVETFLTKYESEISEKPNFLVEKLKDSSLFRKHVKNNADFLIEELDGGYDTGLNYHHRVMRNTPHTTTRSTTDTGHYVSVAGFDERNLKVYVVDPSPNSPEKWWKDLPTILVATMPIWEKKVGERKERGWFTFGPPYRNLKQKDKNRLDPHKVPEYNPTIFVVSQRIKIQPPLSQTELSLEDKRVTQKTS